MYLGDFQSGTGLVAAYFDTASGGDPITLVGGVCAAFHEVSPTPITLGVSLTTDFAGITGLHLVTVDLTDPSFAAGSFSLVLTAGTVASASVVGRVLAHFSVVARSATDPLLNPVPGAYLAGTAGAALGRVGTASVVTSMPVATSGLLTFVRGDDYYAAEGRQLTFTSDDWPDLTGATVTLTIRRRREAFGAGSDNVLISVGDKVASRVDGVGTQTLVFEIGSAATALLLPGTATGKYDIQAVLQTTAHILTLANGLVDVTEDQTR